MDNLCVQIQASNNIELTWKRRRLLIQKINMERDLKPYGKPEKHWTLSLKETEYVFVKHVACKGRGTENVSTSERVG
jgi:hypothetical protein